MLTLKRWESGWINIGVDTGAGKTAWPQNVTCGKTIPGESDLVFRTATGELVKSGNQLHVDGCDDWGTNLRIRGVQNLVCKLLLSVDEHTTKGGVTILYGFTAPRLHDCVQREQRVQHQHETERKQN